MPRGPRHYRKKDKNLSPREIEIIDSVMGGATTADELADQLCIEVLTVRCHLRHIYGKTGARNLADLVLWRIKQGEICGNT